MNHLTQEQLVDHYYGEPQGSLDVDQHLERCEQCRTQYQTLKRVLNSVDGYPVPEPAASYAAGFPSALSQKLRVGNRLRVKLSLYGDAHPNPGGAPLWGPGQGFRPLQPRGNFRQR